MQYLARSADIERNVSPQTYQEHVLHVLVRSRCYLRKVLHYAREGAAAMLRILELAAEYHDLGKLDDENQRVLCGERKAKRLPVPHADAGVAAFPNSSEDLGAFYSAVLIYAHHAGLPDFMDLNIRGMRNASIEQQVDQELANLLDRHGKSVRPAIVPKLLLETTPALIPADIRVLFSCLAHADHGDAARSANEEPKNTEIPKLRSAERIEALRRYVGKLSANGEHSERKLMRSAFFEACSSEICENAIAICDAPVGTGKTTAVMLHLLNTACKRGLRRIFVILPFTNIITQSVKTYRSALVLEGEHAEDVVAEIHHRADFKDPASRKLTALWDAPIVVTTAVAFFETLASASPSTLRRLQNFPGSAVFLDEAHAMLPVNLLSLAWGWIQHAASAWSCHWVLASGSLCRFWSLAEFASNGESLQLSNILSSAQQSALSGFEMKRLHYRYKREVIDLEQLAAWTKKLDGPVIIVLNTVHTAAAAAQVAVGVYGEDSVMHLSTSLTPADRSVTLARVVARLKNKADTSWCLIATSCVEAGMDLSFRTGVRECASLLSLLQLAGRVNRDSEYTDADIWTVTLNANANGVTRNPSLRYSARILRDLFEQGIKISPELCTEAMRKELREQGSFSTDLCNSEKIYAFKAVEDQFKVICDDAQLTVVDSDLVQRIKSFEDVSWRDIQMGSVRIRRNIKDKLMIEESQRYPGVLLWPDGAKYSRLLGYMEAVLELQDFNKNGSAII